MNCLVIGYGSIGSRHADILKGLNCSVSVVSKREVDNNCYYPCYDSVETAFCGNKFDYVVVANNTSEHLSTILSLIELKFSGILLVEKPVFLKYEELPKNAFKHIFVAYNLRFHPMIQKIYNLARESKVYSIMAYAGQYLPIWRPNRDYRNIYSAIREKGGGVIRDLSHELDYLIWILGGWTRVAGIGGKFSELEINSDDVFSLIMETNRCPAVAVQMNYLDRQGQRIIIINLESTTVRADLLEGKIKINDKIIEYPLDRNYTYQEMHKAIIEENHENLCTYQEGLEVLSLIEKVEEASEKGIWVEK